ncbi:MAG: hypothetical protein Q4D81_10520 [Eubacteriales bacterium]|nr:hypothetical protein [Eubacteriales bacterium]
MTALLYELVRGIARIHDEILEINDSFALFLSDKQLHFVLMGMLGMGLLFVIYPLFLLLSKKHVLVIAWIYVFTVMVVFSFAIEIGQGFTGTGTMDLEDVISGLSGFMLAFLVFAAVRAVFLFFAGLFFPKAERDTI